MGKTANLSIQVIFKAEKAKPNYSGRVRMQGFVSYHTMPVLMEKITPASRLFRILLLIHTNTNKFHIVSIMSVYS